MGLQRDIANGEADNLPPYPQRRLCEVPGCDRPAMIRRVQRSGDVLWLCGRIHVYGRSMLGESTND